MRTSVSCIIDEEGRPGWKRPVNNSWGSNQIFGENLDYLGPQWSVKGKSLGDYATELVNCCSFDILQQNLNFCMTIECLICKHTYFSSINTLLCQGLDQNWI